MQKDSCVKNVPTKVCLTTFIYGEKYQDFIPILVYSCHKAYPEYDIFIFLYDTLNYRIRVLLDIINASNVKIIENFFRECTTMSPSKSQATRWVLWDDDFYNYDYLYTIDADMLYIREPIPLHEQHIKHMETTGLCYDNVRRVIKRNPFNFTQLKNRIVAAGFSSIFKYLFGNKLEYRATGLHFVDINKYYSLLKDKLPQYKHLIANNGIYKKAMYPNDEVFLYYMLNDSGLAPEKMAIQTKDSEMLNINNMTKPLFRPHHGIHLHIFQSKNNLCSMSSFEKDTIQSDIYQYYFKYYIDNMAQDPILNQILNNSSEFIQIHFHNLNKFCGIE